MHLQRAVLLFAIVLGLSALAASIAPSPHRGAERATTVAPRTAPKTPIHQAPVLRTVSFAAPPGRHLPVRTVKSNEHVAIQITVASPGQVSLPQLALTAAAEPNTPASFDVLDAAPGVYQVLFTPPSGSPVAIGNLRVSP